MNFHQKTNNRHRNQLMSTENYRTKKRQRILVLIMLMMLGLSTIARPKVKSKYNSLYIPEVVVDSTLHKVLLQKAIPALEICDFDPDVIRIVRSADGYKVIYPDYWDN